MQVVVTYRELDEHRSWSTVCEVLGIDYYARNEGQIDNDDTRTLTHDEAWQLGLVTIPPAVTVDHTEDFT